MIAIMKKILITLIIIMIPLGIYFWLMGGKPEETIISPGLIEEVGFEEESTSPLLLAEGLEVPWALAFLPSGDILLTERVGRVRLITSEGLRDEALIVLDQVEAIGEGGLLGIAIHPQFSENNFVYLYYTYRRDETLTNRVVRMTYQNSSLSNEEIIVDNIPGDSIHNGGRLKFGPDDYLYITTGDAANTDLAQDINSLAGKILRVSDEGEAVENNPFNNLVYSYGHRNPQGLAWDDQGRLWATEHGPSAQDELNLIEKGKNYGWPAITGDTEAENMEVAQLQSGIVDTWAPSGLAFVNNSLFFGGLRGQGLYQVELNNQLNLEKHFAGPFGRIRVVVVGPDGWLYIATSNRDGRGNPSTQDDRLIKIDPNSL
jgi:glucose/arabinose dehydrogenase